MQKPPRTCGGLVTGRDTSQHQAANYSTQSLLIGTEIEHHHRHCLQGSPKRLGPLKSNITTQSLLTGTEIEHLLTGTSNWVSIVSTIVKKETRIFRCEKADTRLR
jgi:hypothetical protein